MTILSDQCNIIWIGHTLREPQSSITRQAVTRKEGKRTAKKHVVARHGVGSEGDEIEGNCRHGATQDPVESFHRSTHARSE